MINIFFFSVDSITPINLEEVVWFTLDWKMPCVLFYSSLDSVDQLSREIPIQQQMDNPFIHVCIQIEVMAYKDHFDDASL